MSVLVLIAAEFALSQTREAEWLAMLSPSRRAQIADWPDARARHRSLIAHSLLAVGLRRLGHPVALMTALRTPLLMRPTVDVPVDFSVSHSDGCVVCALSTSGRVGVDVEALGDVTAADFRRYLSDAERAWAGHSARRFYSVWTRKEAVVKAADSQGLRDLARVDTLLAHQRAGFDGQRWRTVELALGRGHVAHLALSDTPEETPGAVTVEPIGWAALGRGAPCTVADPDATDAAVVL